MKEKLIIKNFGPIKEVELDLGRFNILIGEQATGKSTVAKVLAVCRYFSYLLNGTTSIAYESAFFEGLMAWGISEYVTMQSHIFYSCKHYELTINVFKKISKLGTPAEPVEYYLPIPELKPISPEFKDLLLQVDKIKPKTNNKVSLPSQLWYLPTSFYLNDVKRIMDNPFYLPTERGLQSIFSLGQGSIPNLANFLFNYFSKVDGILKSFNTETEIEPLGITYVNRNGIGYIKKKEDKKFYLLANAASGYQAIIPIVLVIKYYTELYYDGLQKKKMFLIEEPELNLFPAAQDKLMQYIVEKTVNSGNSVLVTTQSPYILASVNNLIYAHIVGQSFNKEVTNITPEKYWLDPSIVSAYRLFPDGTYKNIIDEDLKEIIVEELDGAGKEINAVYDKILDIKFRKNEKS